MQLRNIGSNQSVLCLNDGTVVLFSYNTPVAAHIPGKAYIRTNKHHSMTTTRHINAWVGDCDVVDQSVIDSLVK